MNDLDPWAALTLPHYTLTRREQEVREASFLVDPPDEYVSPAEMDQRADREARWVA